MKNDVFLDCLTLTLLGVPQGENNGHSYEFDFIYTLAESLGGLLEVRLSGGKGYPKSATIKGTLENGIQWVVFCAYGSMNLGQHMSIECKGQMTEHFRDVFLSFGVDWSLSRADIALDMMIDFDEARSICLDYANKKKIYTNLIGDWESKERGLDPKGRTYQIGANRKECESLIRLYEKGLEMKQQGVVGVPEELIRLELEFKPKKHKRQHIKSLDARDILSFAINPLELFNTFHDLGIEGVRVNGKKEHGYKQSVRHMMTQYLSQIKEWKDQEGLVSLFEEIEYAIEHGHVVQS